MIRINCYLIAILFSFKSLVGYAQEFVTVSYVKSDIASLSKRTGSPVVVRLPISLRTAVATFPDYRIPNNRDYKLDWIEFYNSYPVPFIAIGDFNYDGRQDVAILLVSKTIDNVWKNVIFHKTESGYLPIELNSSPNTSKAAAEYGRNYGPIQNYAIAAADKCTNNRSCLALLAFEASRFEYIWSIDRYIEVNTAD